MPATREQVYKAIDSEREYQNQLGPDRTEDHGEGHTVGEYLVMLDRYITYSKEQWVRTAGDERALDVVRKIAGIAVRCMEDHGAPHREGF